MPNFAIDSSARGAAALRLQRTPAQLADSASHSAGDVFDVAVVGAGPAGLTAALWANQAGARVLLCEPQAGARDKPCGEGLMPEGAEALLALGLEDLVRGALPLITLAYRLGDGTRLDVPLPRPGLCIARPTLIAALEAALGQSSAAGQLVRWEHKVRVERLASSEQAMGAASPSVDGLRFALQAGDLQARARTVVLADGLGGAASEALIGLGEGQNRPRAGLRARCQALRPLNGVEIHLGRGAELYLTPLPNGEINVAALFDSPPPDCRGAGQILDAVRKLYPAAAEYLGPLSTPPALRNLAARPPRSFAQDGAFVAGDAAGGVDPVLGCGVTIALISGLSAARSALAVVAGGDLRIAASDHQRLVLNQVRVRRRLAAGLKWLSRHPRLLGATARFLQAVPMLTRVALRLVVCGSGSPSAPSSRPGTRNFPAPLSATGGA